MQRSGSLSPSSRVRFLREGLAKGKHATRVWANAWGATWTVATLAQGAIAATTSDRDTAQDLWVGSASAALGLIPTWILPPVIVSRELSSASDPSENSCEALAQAEALLEQAAKNDQQNTGVWVHASNVLVNVGIGLGMGLGFHHWGSAAISTGIGIPVGELMILTYPQSALKLRERYVKGNLSSERFRSPGFWERVHFAAIPLPSGAAVAMSLGFDEQ
jgi:hypothetical protein